MLDGIPAGTTVFIDANIFYLHFVFLPEAETACRQATRFLKRVESGQLVCGSRVEVAAGDVAR